MRQNPVGDAAATAAWNLLTHATSVSLTTTVFQDRSGQLQRPAREDLDIAFAGRTFLHMIHAEVEVQDLAASSKLNAEWSYLRSLFERGRRWADALLAVTSTHLESAPHSTLENCSPIRTGLRVSGRCLESRPDTGRIRSVARLPVSGHLPKREGCGQRNEESSCQYGEYGGGSAPHESFRPS
jgi:hypothetical protein